MRKLIPLLLIIILLCFQLIGCSNNDSITDENSLYKADEAPEISIEYDNTSIDYHIALNCWNNTMYDRLDSVEYIMGNNDFDSIPYLQNDTIIDIKFSKEPDNIIVKDTLVDKEGKLNWTHILWYFYYLHIQRSALITNQNKIRNNKIIITQISIKIICTRNL